MQKILFTAALSAGFVASTHAAPLVPLYTSNFNSPTYADGPLRNSPDNTDTTTAGQDGWINTSGGGTNNIAVSNAGTNGIVTLTTSGQDVRHPYAAQTTGSIYLKADINVTAAQATGDYFLHLGDGSTTIFNARTYIKSSGAGFVMALGTGSGAVNYGSTVLNLNQSYTVLVRYDIVAGTTNDSGALFVNPTSADGSADTAYVAATLIGADAVTMSSVNFRQGTGANAPSLTIDNLSVSIVAPEPTTLGAIAGASILGLRRRRA